MNKLTINSNYVDFLFILLITLILVQAFFTSILLLLVLVPLTFLFLFTEKKKIVVVLFFYFFLQNFYIAYLSNRISYDLFSLLHGIHVLLLLLCFAFTVNTTFKYNLSNKQKILFIIVSFIILGYYLIGVFFYGVKNATIYFRLFYVPIMMYFIGIYLSNITEISFLDRILKFLLIFVVSSVAIYLISYEFALYIFNDKEYFNQKLGGYDQVYNFFHQSFFNAKSKQEVLRTGGVLKTIISASYFVTILSLYLYSKNRLSLFAVIFFLFLINLTAHSKGGLFLLIFIILFFIGRKLKISNGIMILFYLLIWLSIIIIGFYQKNEHLLGFINGLDYLFGIGNGLGFSGNLSNIQWVDYRGEHLPKLGYFTRFQNGSESSFGVMFSSLGVMSFVYVLTVLSFILSSVKYFTLLRVMSLFVFFLGVYQEEAFSPYALGMCLFLCGLHSNKYIIIIKKQLSE